MAATLLVASAVTAVALLGLLGRVPRLGTFTMAQAFTVGLPLIAIAAGPSLIHGFTLTSAIISTIAVAVGVLLAAFLGPVRNHPFEGRAVRAGFAWIAAAAVVLVLAGLFVAWITTLVAAFTFLDSRWVSVVIVLAAGAMAYGRGAFRGTALAATVIGIGFAGLLLLGGLVAGSVDSLSDAVITYTETPAWQTIGFAVSVAVVGATNLGWRSVSGAHRPALVTGGLVLAGTLLVGAFGLLLLVGGAIAVPSVPLETLVAYTPLALSALIAGVLALLGAIVAGQAVAMVIEQSKPLAPALIPFDRPRLGRLIAVLLLAAVLILVALISPSPTWLIPLLAFIGIIGVLIEFTGRDSGGATPESAGRQASESTTP